MPPQAVLLAAGDAERLMPLTESRPKGMLLLGGKPLLQYAVEALKRHDITDVTIVVGRHGERIQDFFRDGADFGVRVQYVHQADPTGTTGALRCARPLLDADRDVWVLSGAVFVTPESLAPLTRGSGDAVLVAVAGDEHEQPVPSVRGDRLQGLRWEVPSVGSTRVMTGLYRLAWSTFAALGNGEEANEVEDALGRRADAGSDVAVLTTKGPWHRLIDPWDVLRLNEHVLDALPRAPKPARGPSISGAVRVGDNTSIARSATLIGPVTIGDGCTVGENTVVGPYVSIRNNTVVGAHCEVRRSIVNNNVYVDSRSLVRGCIVDDGVRLGPGFLGHDESTPHGPVGCIIGRDCTVGAGARGVAGTVVAAETAVPAGGVLS